MQPAGEAQPIPRTYETVRGRFLFNARALPEPLEPTGSLSESAPDEYSITLYPSSGPLDRRLEEAAC